MTSSTIDSEGIWPVYKPVGISSFGLVARIRRLTGVRKVGHAGTLDPQAEGLMIILVGKDYTRQADSFLKLDKTYEVEATLGLVSSTGDREGEFSQVSHDAPSRQAVELALKAFEGDIMQTPPAYSAIKIDGQRAYKLARAGKEVVIEPRQVRINNIKLLEYSYPRVHFTVDVSSGTYIRSLVEDIGAHLGVGAYMSALKRTRVGKYSLAEAVHID